VPRVARRYRLFSTIRLGTFVMAFGGGDCPPPRPSPGGRGSERRGEGAGARLEDGGQIAAAGVV